MMSDGELRVVVWIRVPNAGNYHIGVPIPLTESDLSRTSEEIFEMVVAFMQMEGTLEKCSVEPLPLDE